MWFKSNGVLKFDIDHIWILILMSFWHMKTTYIWFLDHSSHSLRSMERFRCIRKYMKYSALNIQSTFWEENIFQLWPFRVFERYFFKTAIPKIVFQCIFVLIMKNYFCQTLYESYILRKALKVTKIPFFMLHWTKFLILGVRNQFWIINGC